MIWSRGVEEQEWAASRRQINHFAHYLPRQGVGTAYMLRGSAQLEHISAVFGYSGLINSQDRYEEEFSLYMGYFIWFMNRENDTYVRAAV